jgi:hypothetical protein
MSEQSKNKKTVTKNPQHGTGIYVYCIGKAEELEKVSKRAVHTGIEDNASIEFLYGEDLVAVTSRVPLPDYDEENLSQRLLDPSWIAVRAMRHEQIVEHFAKHCSVVPLRFGTIYLESSHVTQMLRDQRSQLNALLEVLRDSEEWGINVFFDQNKLLKSIDTISPLLRGLSVQAEKASPGQSYLLQKKASALKKDEARLEMERTIGELEAAFRANSDGLRRLRTLKVEATEQGELKAKFAVLLKRSAFENFRKTSERLAEKHEASGLRLEFAGPLPPYNFTQRD